MTPPPTNHRRGLSLLETTIAMAITALIGTAIATMMAAVSGSLASREDGRGTAIRLATTQVRLGAYIAPSRCLLDGNDGQLVLWVDDSRESNTVHASEVRWIYFDAQAGTIDVSFVDFPDTWSQSQVDEADVECTFATDYDALRDDMAAANLLATLPLVDAVDACAFWFVGSDPTQATRLGAHFALGTLEQEAVDALVDETIRMHQPPQE
jgi:type II secretory pathway pseudopilin PulG